MPMSQSDLILLSNLRAEKGWGAKKIISEFPNKHWSLTTVKFWLRRYAYNVYVELLLLRLCQ